MSEGACIFAGSLLGVIFTMIVFSWLTEDNRKAIIDCEKELPRNQYCELIAVPRVRPEK
jgi:hypothetical protein